MSLVTSYDVFDQPSLKNRANSRALVDVSGSGTSVSEHLSHKNKILTNLNIVYM